jgi:hypothetical protein
MVHPMADKDRQSAVHLPINSHLSKALCPTTIESCEVNSSCWLLQMSWSLPHTMGLLNKFLHAPSQSHWAGMKYTSNPVGTQKLYIKFSLDQFWLHCKLSCSLYICLCFIHPILLEIIVSYFIQVKTYPCIKMSWKPNERPFMWPYHFRIILPIKVIEHEPFPLCHVGKLHHAVFRSLILLAHMQTIYL